MSTDSTSVYITRFDGVRVLAAEYQPVWVANLAAPPSEQERSDLAVPLIAPLPCIRKASG
jgi:hypothetical protein